MYIYESADIPTASYKKRKIMIEIFRYLTSIENIIAEKVEFDIELHKRI